MLCMTLQNSLSMTFVGKKFEFYHCILFNVVLCKFVHVIVKSCV